MGTLRKAWAWLARNRLFLLIAFTYAYFYQGGDPNQASRLFLTRALVERHAPDITPDAMHVIDKGFFEGRYFSDKAPGVSGLATAPYEIMNLADRAFGIDASSRVAQQVRLHMLSVVTSGLAGALAAYFLWRVLRLFGSEEKDANLLVIGYALGTLVFPFSTVMFGHMTAAAVLLASFFLLIDARLAGGAPSTKRLLGLGLLWGSSIVLEYPTAMLVAVMGLYLLSWEASRRAVLRSFGWVAFAAALPLAIHSAFLTWAFGSPVALPYKHLVEPIFLSHTSSGLLGIGIPTKDGTFGTLLSRYRGIFYYCPFLILVFAGFRAWIRKGERMREAALMAALVVVYLLFSFSYYAWDGGGSTGPRHLVPAMAFFVIPMGYFVRQGAAAVWLTRGAVLVSVLIMGACVAVMVQLPEGDVRTFDPLHELVLPALLRGEIAQSPQDVAFAPVLRRDASYNLGLLVHLSPFASLLVPCAVWLLALAPSWVAALLRRRESAPGALRPERAAS